MNLIGDENKEVLLKSKTAGLWEALVPMNYANGLLTNKKATLIDNKTLLKHDDQNCPQYITNVVKLKYKNKCAECDKTGKCIFPIVPKVLGGKHAVSNLLFLCRSCTSDAQRKQIKEYPLINNSKLLANFKNSSLTYAEFMSKQNLHLPIKCKNEITRPSSPSPAINTQEYTQSIVWTDSETGYGLSSHALKRIRERSANANITNKKAFEYCMKIIRDGEYLGKTMCSEDKLSDTYIYKKERLCVRDKEIITYISTARSPYEPIKEKILKTYKAELNRLRKASQTRERYLDNLKMESEVEIAEMKLRIHRARTEATKLSCQARIKAIEISLNEYEAELKEIYKNKSIVVDLVMFAS